MASKLTALTATAALTAASIFYVVVDPGSPVSQKVTLANLEAKMTVANLIGGTATGTGSLVRASSPTLVTPALGTPSSVNLTNGTALPVGGITASGTPSAATYLRGDASWATPAGSVTAATATVCSSGCDYTLPSAAVAACPAAGCDIFVKDGTYTETATISVIRSNTRLILSGGAVVEANGASVSPLVNATSSLSRIEVRGGKWLQTNATAQGTAFDFSNVSSTILAPTRVEAWGKGVVYSDTASQTFYNILRDTQFFDVNNCVEYSGTQANNNHVIGIRCRPKLGGGGTGLSVVDARGLTVVGSDFEAGTGGSSGLTGVSIDATSREITLLNSWIENLDTGLSIASGANRVTVIGTTVTGNATADIVDSGTGTAFVNTNKTGTLVAKQKLNVPVGLGGVALDVTQADTTNNPRAASFVNSGTAATLFVDPNGAASASTSVGGAVLVENTGNNGSGIVVYSNNSTPTSGARLLSLRADNTSFSEAVQSISNDGTGAALSINGTGGTGVGVTISSAGTGTNHSLGVNYTGTSSSGAAGSFTSSNTAFSTLQISGHEFGHGTMKLSHVGDGASSDGNAAGVSIDLQNSDAGTGTTAAQGIFITSTTGGTTGALMQLKNNMLAFGGADAQVGVFTVSGRGNVGIGVPTATVPIEKFTIGTGGADQPIFAIAEGTAPSLTSGYGKIYDKSSDSKLYFMDDGGAEFRIGGNQAVASYSSGPQTLTAANEVVVVTSGTFTVNLPTAVGITGKSFKIKNSGAGTVTLDANSTETIDGSTTVAMGTQYQALELVSDGANWVIF